tara:strand:- start:327 stop:1598 length:1272 start_codon:yes stop_codon:yes gene_type:complete
LIKKETYQFLKNVITLFTGTSIAQLISIVTLIILQRYFYSPEEYAPFRLFFEFSAVFSGICALRLESGLILERNDNSSLSLLRTCIKFCIYISIIGGVIFTIYYYSEIKVFNFEWILLAIMPLSIFGNGIIQISQSFFTRSKQFIIISSSKVIQSISGAGIQLLTGFMGFNFTGLIIGRMAGLLSADFNYLRSFLKSYRWPIRNRKEEKRLIQKHRRFIWFTSPGVFVGNSINLIILILFTHFYGEQFTGLTAAAIQYLGLICLLFSTSFSQVYYNEIAQIEDPKKIISSYSYWIKRLGILTVLGWLILFFTPSSFITYILGEKWSNLLYIIKLISPWIGIMFMASSLSYIFIRLGKQKEIFLFDVFHLILITSALYIGHHLFNDKFSTLKVITIVQSIFYILSICLAYLFMIKNTKIKDNIN